MNHRINAIPEPYVWDESFKVFVSFCASVLTYQDLVLIFAGFVQIIQIFFLIWQYESLDEQHQGLFQAIFSLSRYPTDADVLKHLVETMDEHFKHEEVK